MFCCDLILPASLGVLWRWGNCMVNSLIPGRPRCHFKIALFNLVLLTGIFTSSKANALRCMPWDLTDDKSTLDQVMVWCRQATSHYLKQCWSSCMSPYGVIRPQWVNPSTHQWHNPLGYGQTHNANLRDNHDTTEHNKIVYMFHGHNFHWGLWITAGDHKLLHCCHICYLFFSICGRWCK